MNKFKKYWSDIYEGFYSSIGGLSLTLKHLFQAHKRTNSTVSISSTDYFTQATGIVTLEYPAQSLPVPDNGRYRLHNEIDDCIVCDKCAKICPVDCIDITSIKSAEEIGITSDGSSKRLYAATFDIDMAKCCYCGLCTTVCPTECLTMTSTYDFSEFDVKNMVYHFTDLTPDEAKEKQRLYEIKQSEKAAALAAKAATTDPVTTITTEASGIPKPAFKPKFPVSKPSENTPSEQIQSDLPVESKPVFKPKMPGIKMPASVVSAEEQEKISGIQKEESSSSETPVAPKPVFKPKMPGIKMPAPVVSAEEPEKITSIQKEEVSTSETPVATKPVFKPKMKPVIPPKPEGDQNLS